ncbi:hypothetical protein D3C72_1587670 [compost metagenome]
MEAELDLLAADIQFLAPGVRQQKAPRGGTDTYRQFTVHAEIIIDIKSVKMGCQRTFPD